EKLSAFLASLEEKGVQIMKKNVKIDTNGGMWVIDGTFLVREKIGKNVAVAKPDSVNSKLADTADSGTGE
ncbi:MAG: hypothetical protein ACI4R5_04135, partial [Acetatifactor sp.]